MEQVVHQLLEYRATSIVGPAGRTLSTLGLAVSCNNYVCSTQELFVITAVGNFFIHLVSVMINIIVYVE